MIKMHIRRKLLWNYALTCTIAFLAMNAIVAAWPRPSIALPVNPAQLDYSGASYLIWPYGVKGGDHPEGHPGIDFSWNFSGPIHAACDAIITSITPNNNHPGTFEVDTVPIGYPFTTVVYDEVLNLSASTTVLATVKQGDVIAHAQPVGGFYMFHFAVRQIENLWTWVPVSPEYYFNDTALSIIGKSIWDPGTLMNKSHYTEQPVSPYLTTKETPDFYAKNGVQSWILLGIILGGIAVMFFIMNGFANKKRPESA